MLLLVLLLHVTRAAPACEISDLYADLGTERIVDLNGSTKSGLSPKIGDIIRVGCSTTSTSCTGGMQITGSGVNDAGFKFGISEAKKTVFLAESGTLDYTCQFVNGGQVFIKSIQVTVLEKAAIPCEISTMTAAPAAGSDPSKYRVICETTCIANIAILANNNEVAELPNTDIYDQVINLDGEISPSLVSCKMSLEGGKFDQQDTTIILSDDPAISCQISRFEVTLAGSKPNEYRVICETTCIANIAILTNSNEVDELENTDIYDETLNFDGKISPTLISCEMSSDGGDFDQKDTTITLSDDPPTPCQISTFRVAKAGSKPNEYRAICETTCIANIAIFANNNEIAELANTDIYDQVISLNGENMSPTLISCEMSSEGGEFDQQDTIILPDPERCEIEDFRAENGELVCESNCRGYIQIEGPGGWSSPTVQSETPTLYRVPLPAPRGTYTCIFTSLSGASTEEELEVVCEKGEEYTTALPVEWYRKCERFCGVQDCDEEAEYMEHCQTSAEKQGNEVCDAICRCPILRPFWQENECVAECNPTEEEATTTSAVKTWWFIVVLVVGILLILLLIAVVAYWCIHSTRTVPSTLIQNKEAVETAFNNSEGSSEEVLYTEGPYCDADSEGYLAPEEMRGAGRIPGLQPPALPTAPPPALPTAPPPALDDTLYNNPEDSLPRWATGKEGMYHDPASNPGIRKGNIPGRESDDEIEINFNPGGDLYENN